MQESDTDVRIHLARGDRHAAPIPDAERALLEFVETITKHAHRVTDEQVEGLRQHGWTDPQIAECVYIAALFAFFNRVADAFGLEDPNYFGDVPPGLKESHGTPSNDEGTP